MKCVRTIRIFNKSDWPANMEELKLNLYMNIETIKFEF